MAMSPEKIEELYLRIEELCNQGLTEGQVEALARVLRKAPSVAITRLEKIENSQLEGLIGEELARREGQI